jgi:serine/threonine protein kinase
LKGRFSQWTDQDDIVSKNYSSNGAVIRLRELQALLNLPIHPFVVRTYEIHRTKMGLVHFVMEHVTSGNLADLLSYRAMHNLGSIPSGTSSKPLSGMNDETNSMMSVDKNNNDHPCIERYLVQITLGLQHLHQHGYMHRDLKPENILLSEQYRVCKIADFSLARSIVREPSETRSKHVKATFHAMSSPCFPLTSYCATRWYRAPELLLGLPYGLPMDCFALGCILAEMVRLVPLFPGQNELEQLMRYISVLGLPQSETKATNGMTRPHAKAFHSSSIMSPNRWSDGAEAWQKQFRSRGWNLDGAVLDGKKYNRLRLANAIPTASLSMLDLLEGLLRLNPSYRFTTFDVLKHQFVREHAPDTLQSKTLNATEQSASRLNNEKTAVPLSTNDHRLERDALNSHGPSSTRTTSGFGADAQQRYLSSRQVAFAEASSCQQSATCTAPLTPSSSSSSVSSTSSSCVQAIPIPLEHVNSQWTKKAKIASVSPTTTEIVNSLTSPPELTYKSVCSQSDLTQVVMNTQHDASLSAKRKRAEPTLSLTKRNRNHNV